MCKVSNNNPIISIKRLVESTKILLFNSFFEHKQSPESVFSNRLRAKSVYSAESERELGHGAYAARIGVIA